MGWRGEPPHFFPSAEHTTEKRSKVDRIVKNLYLTNFMGAEDEEELRRVKCTHIVAVGKEFLDNSQNHAGQKLKVQFYNVDVTDDEKQREVMAGAIRGAAIFIMDALKNKKARVVVHCAAGDSRSATIVIGYLLMCAKYELLPAFTMVRHNRPCVWPNNGFMKALIDLETANRRGKDKGKPPTITAADYERWGEYEGPEAGDVHADDPHYKGLNKEQRKLLSATSTQQVAAWHSGDRTKAEIPGGGSPDGGKKLIGFGVARSATRSLARMQTRSIGGFSSSGRGLNSSGRLNLRSSHADLDSGGGTGEGGSSAHRVGVFTGGKRLVLGMLGFKPRVGPHRAG